MLIKLHEEGKFPFHKMIRYYSSLNDINTAMEDAKLGKVIKPVICISDEPDAIEE